MLGFVTALLARGTGGVLASTAEVPDVAAVELMTAVYRRLARGATLASALHEARASHDTRDPGGFVNWCTFNVHGAALEHADIIKLKVGRPAGTSHVPGGADGQIT